MPYIRPPRGPLPPESTAAAAPSVAEPTEAASPRFPRRPATFAPAGELPLAATHASKVVSVANAAWYEDIRFGVALFFILALLNLGLIYALPLSINHPANETVTIVQSGASTDEIKTQPPVTLYAPPEESAPQIIAKKKAEDKAMAEALTQATPHAEKDPMNSADFPPPQAIPLDGNKSMDENVNGQGNAP